MKRFKFKFGVNLPTLLLVYLGIALVTGAAIGISNTFFPQNDISYVSPVESDKVVEKTTTTTATKKVNVPATALLNIPFTVQAPLNNWNIHDESCEEAGILMVHYYFQNIPAANGVIQKDIANSELIAMKDWQVAHYGKEPDLDMTALGQFAKDYYGYNFEVKKNITENDVKEAIAEGNPVFLPVITHGLQNSMYGTQPSYHVLLIRGYDETGVIANDSGVGNGQAHHYNWDIVWQAVDQQTAKMNQGRDMVIIKK